MSKHAIIVSGGLLEEDFILRVIGEHKKSHLIGVDRGAELLYQHNILPSFLVGDFDSLSNETLRYYREETQVSIREFNPQKDASDTEIAVQLAIEIGCKEILLLGATGNRIDHLWANVQVLMIGYKAGVQISIMDSHNLIRLIDGETHLKKEEAFGTYFSVFPMNGVVKNFNITGAKYPLTNHVLEPYNSLCVSNQIKEEEVVISFPKGIVILMETKDY